MSSKTLKITEERNFRSSYYERVGCRGVEEKKSLEILLKDKPWDKSKLKQFCLRFTVPAAYRNLIWKVLLGILPVYPDSHTFVMEQRSAQYEDLLYAQNILKLVAEPATQPDIMLAMWQLETGQITPMNFPHSNYPSSTTFKTIATSLLDLGIEDVDVYWCSKGLTETVKGFQSELPKMKDTFLTMLDKEDHELYSHMLDIKALDVLPLTDWLNCAFAGVLDETSLAKIWDKLVAGAPKILAYVGVMLLITMRRCILRSQHSDQLLLCLSQIPEQCEEVVANKAIELWQYYGANPQNDQIKNK